MYILPQLSHLGFHPQEGERRRGYLVPWPSRRRGKVSRRLGEEQGRRQRRIRGRRSSRRRFGQEAAVVEEKGVGGGRGATNRCPPPRFPFVFLRNRLNPESPGCDHRSLRTNRSLWVMNPGVSGPPDQKITKINWTCVWQEEHGF